MGYEYGLVHVFSKLSISYGLCEIVLSNSKAGRLSVLSAPVSSFFILGFLFFAQNLNSFLSCEFYLRY